MDVSIILTVLILLLLFLVIVLFDFLIDFLDLIEDLVFIFYRLIKGIIFKFQNISTNKNFIFVNENGYLKIFKTNKTKEEIQAELDKLNIPNFDFNKYFIFVEKNRIKQLKKEKLLKQFEQNIRNKIFQLEEFESLKQKIKTIIKKQKLEIKNRKIDNILFENNSNNSFNKNIDLENSIKEIKN